MSTLIETRELEKDFTRGETVVQALRGISVSIDTGDFVAIIGQSGSGKSTFMNILGCLDRPSRGQCLLGNRDISRLTSDERAELRGDRIGFVFQSFNLIPRTSALENVELPLIYSGISVAEQRQRARQALDRLGLSDRSHHHPSQLSGGEQQRVAIARALVNRPRILMADEPTGNLDTRTSLEIMKILVDLNREQDLTILLVTHEPEIAAFANRVLTFRDGEIVADKLQEASTPVLSRGEIPDRNPQ